VTEIDERVKVMADQKFVPFAEVMEKKKAQRLRETLANKVNDKDLLKQFGATITSVIEQEELNKERELLRKQLKQKGLDMPNRSLNDVAELYLKQ